MGVRTIGLCLAILLLTAAPRGADRVIRLTDVAAEAGIDLLNIAGSATKDLVMDANGNGAAWFDYDRDGDLDLLIVNGSRFEQWKRGGDQMVALYRNDGGGKFTNVTHAAGLDRKGWGTGVCVGDYDNDGFEDVYITAIGPNVLWHNTGHGTFTTTGEAADPRWSTGCAFGDYDRDGLLDLYVANYVRFDPRTGPPSRMSGACHYLNITTFCGPRPLVGESDVLYRNTGNGHFTDVSRAAGIVDPGYYGFGVLFEDLDDDGWPDIFVANDSVPNLFFRNLGNGTFAEQGLLSGLAVSANGREQAGMGVDAGDLDGDGRIDLVKTNFAQDYTTIFSNEGNGLFRDVSSRFGVLATLGPHMGWGVGLVDIDNDGLLDLFVANGHVYPDVIKTGTSTYAQKSDLFMNTGHGRLRLVTGAGGGLAIEKSSRGAAFGDYDNDGDIDVLVVNMDDRPTLLRNDSDQGHWITLRLVGVRSNRDGIGAKVTAQAGGRRQVAMVHSGGSYLSHNDMRVHFGLGAAAIVDQITIRWPSGQVDTLNGLAADRFYVAREGAGVKAGL